ncbi:MAG TPA: SRPBCC domain-containing protein [Terriglobia bacterium]|nr:SRPBCC domain-containing protein [Terriglobia bacterium]
MMSPTVRIVDENIVGEVEIAAPPERVYAALTDPAELAAWWGSGEVYRTFDWESDLRVGGKRNCKAENKTTGQMSTVKGEYLEIDPPRVLAFTWEPSWEKVHPTVVRIELKALASGTRLVLTHSGWGEATQARRSHEQGWPLVLGWLAAHFRK